MELLVTPDGAVRCIYSEQIDLHCLGQPAISRGSHVEPDQHGRWFADMSPVAGPRLGPFDQRSQALEAENRWLEEHWLRGYSTNADTPVLWRKFYRCSECGHQWDDVWDSLCNDRCPVCDTETEPHEWEEEQQ